MMPLERGNILICCFTRSAKLEVILLIVGLIALQMSWLIKIVYFSRSATVTWLGLPLPGVTVEIDLGLETEQYLT